MQTGVPFISPHRFTRHLPSEIGDAEDLEEVQNILEDGYGPADVSEAIQGVEKIGYQLGDRELVLFRDSGGMIGIHSLRKPITQAFFRPCSGLAGPLTATGSATGFTWGFPSVVIPLLAIAAQADATLAFYRLLPLVCRVCNPCWCVPVGFFAGGITIKSAGFMKVTVTIDVTSDLLCI